MNLTIKECNNNDSQSFKDTAFNLEFDPVHYNYTLNTGRTFNLEVDNYCSEITVTDQDCLNATFEFIV